MKRAKSFKIDITKVAESDFNPRAEKEEPLNGDYELNNLLKRGIDTFEETLDILKKIKGTYVVNGAKRLSVYQDLKEKGLL